jgi:hypothetical protein
MLSWLEPLTASDAGSPQTAAQEVSNKEIA